MSTGHAAQLMVGNRSLREAVISRNEGIERLRRLTGAALALTVAAAGVFAGIAASSNHGRRAVHQSIPGGGRGRAAPVGTVPAPAATVPVAGGGPASPSAPPSAPSAAAPVVVSGGS